MASNPQFMHHQWFIEWHVVLVAPISAELAERYPEANRELVEAMAWMHDYPKMLDRDNERDRKLLDIGRDKLIELGFTATFANKVADYVELLDSHQTVDLSTAPIEVQVVSSADGCSHLVGPFMLIFWQEFSNKPYEELMAGNRNKSQKDWEGKVVLPEARAAFQKYYEVLQVQCGMLPEQFLPRKEGIVA